MDKYIISAEEISANNVKSAADLLKGDPAQNKSVFDRLPELIAEKLNGFITAVKAKFAEYYTKAETEAVIDERMQQAGGADMLQAVYDKNHSGVVDDAERLGGHLPEYFASQDTAVLKSGGAMTGPLTLSADPTEDMHAATKQYADKLANKVLLWENAKPSSSFSPQAITIETLPDYSWYILEFYGYNESTTVDTAVIVKNGGTILTGDLVKTRRYRTIKIYGTTLDIGVGRIFSSYNQSAETENNGCIPLRLYGAH